LVCFTEWPFFWFRMAPVQGGQGDVNRVPGFRRAGGRASSIATSVAQEQRAGFPARSLRAAGKADRATAGYPLGEHRGAVRFAGSSEDALGTTGSATAIRSIASPAFARRMVVIIMIAMLGCGLVLGLTHAVPWVSATDTGLSGQPPVDESPAVEVQATAPQSTPAADARNTSTRDMMPLAAPAGVVQPAASAAPVQPLPSSSASVAAPPEPPAQDQSSAMPLNPPIGEATPEPTAAVPATEEPAPVAHEKPASKKTSTAKVATKKPAAKRAASREPTLAEAPAQSPAIDITTPR
jgi:hypothetical protein